MMDRKTLIAPILLIGVGVGWLLTSMNIVPGMNWVWTLGLAVAGIVALLTGFDKVTFVTGFFFIFASILSYLRQTERIVVDHEMPILVILAGVLLLAARHPGIQIPSWVNETAQRSDS